LGGANQIAEPDDRLAIGDVVQAKIFAFRNRKWAERRRFPEGGDEPYATLDATRGTVAASMGRYDGSLGQAPLSRKRLVALWGTGRGRPSGGDLK
jgi:hypothetical protein